MEYLKFFAYWIFVVVVICLFFYTATRKNTDE